MGNNKVNDCNGRLLYKMIAGERSEIPGKGDFLKQRRNELVEAVQKGLRKGTKQNHKHR